MTRRLRRHIETLNATLCTTLPALAGAYRREVATARTERDRAEAALARTRAWMASRGYCTCEACCLHREGATLADLPTPHDPEAPLGR